MADSKKEVAPKDYSSLPAEYIGKRTLNGEEVAWTFKKGLLRKKSKGANDRYALRPLRPMNDEDASKLIAFGGMKLVAESFFRQTAQMATRWSNNSFDAGSGLFVPEEFAKCVDKYSARGETLKALRDEKEELNQEIIDVSKDSTLDVQTKAKRFEEIASRLSEIADAIEFRQARPEDEDEEGQTDNGQ